MTHNISNRLAKSNSPYLRSAAGQPVQWFEWGEEAFAEARAKDRPILLDIGAVWCHWCHVIDRESYEDPELAELINRDFVPVKVDRDERPDVDARYQTAISAVSGQGGWPLTGFLLPDGRPFYGGTYFPPREAMGRPSFRRVLEQIAAAYKSRREEVERAAEALSGAVARAELLDGAHAKWDAGVLDQLTASLVERYDARHGGFGQAPKFPHSAAIDFLLEQFQAQGNRNLLTMAETTLEQMARGGVYDQLGGGFHRYSVDERWLVPHFEKMSYDNSELLKNYLHGYAVTGRPLFRQIAEGIVDWVNGTLSDSRGGFYASQDADVSLDDDGDYFTWTLEEVRAALPAEQARIAELYYDVGAAGEMHHNPAKNVLWVARDVEWIAKTTGMAAERVKQVLEKARAGLLSARSRRKAPFVDQTLYASWNGMFISAYLEAAQVLDDERGRACRRFALRTMERFLGEGWQEQRGFAHRLGPDWLWGSLEDQAHMVNALLDAFEATLEQGYFQAAEKTAGVILEKYADAEAGGFFDRSKDAPPMGGLDVARKPFQDSPTPAGNCVAAIALDRLYAYTGKQMYRERAEATLNAFAGIAPQYGLFAATYGLASILHARHPIQVVVTGAAGDPAARQLEAAAGSVYRFGKSVLRVTPERLSGAMLPAALRETLPHLRAEAAVALVCSGTRCFPPVKNPEELAGLIAQAGRESPAAAGR